MTDAGALQDDAAEPAPASNVLRDLAASPVPITLGDVVTAMGSRAHGLALVLLALPDTLPLPIPSTSTVLGIPLVIIAAHLVLYGEGSSLPQRAKKLAISPAMLKTVVHFAAPVLRALERLSRPRLAWLLRSDRALGLLCLYLSILLLLPIPFLNAAPAACLVAISLGMVHRDGAMVGIGVVGTAIVTLSLGYFADWVGRWLGA